MSAFCDSLGYILISFTHNGVNSFASDNHCDFYNDYKMIRMILCTVYFPLNQLKAYVTINKIAFILLSQAFIDILTQAAVIN